MANFLGEEGKSYIRHDAHSPAGVGGQGTDLDSWWRSEWGSGSQENNAMNSQDLFRFVQLFPCKR